MLLYSPYVGAITNTDMLMLVSEPGTGSIRWMAKAWDTMAPMLLSTYGELKVAMFTVPPRRAEACASLGMVNRTMEPGIGAAPGGGDDGGMGGGLLTNPAKGWGDAGGGAFAMGGACMTHVLAAGTSSTASMKTRGPLTAMVMEWVPPVMAMPHAVMSWKEQLSPISVAL